MFSNKETFRVHNPSSVLRKPCLLLVFPSSLRLLKKFTFCSGSVKTFLSVVTMLLKATDPNDPPTLALSSVRREKCKRLRRVTLVLYKDLHSELLFTPNFSHYRYG